MKKIIFLFLIIFTAYGEYGDWLTLTHPGGGTDVVRAGDDIAISSTGVLLITGQNGDKIIDSDDGLYNPTIVKLTYDYRGILWCLHPSGSISLYNMESEEFTYLTDLSESGEYQAYDIYSSDDYIYVSTTTTLIRYRFDERYKKYIVDENNTQFREPNIFAYDNELYIFNDQEIKVIDEDSGNFNISFWSDLQPSEDLVVNDIIAFNNKPIFLTDKGLFEKAGSTIVKIEGIDEINYIGGYVDSELYLMVRGNKVDSLYKTDLSSLTEIAPLMISNSNSFVKYGSTYIFNHTDNIFYSYNGNSISFPNFDLPTLDNISNMSFTNSGKMIYTNNRDVSYFDLENYSFDFKGVELNTGSIRNIYVDNNNSIHVGTWGSGFFNLEMKDDEIEILNRFNYHTGDLGTYAVSPSIIGSGSDLYFVNWAYNSYDQAKLITKIDTGSQDSTRIDFNIGSMVYGHELFISSNNWLWVGTNNQFSQPLSGVTIAVKDLSSEEIVNVELELAITSITEDKDNNIWIGTTEGAYFIDLDQLSSVSSLTSNFFQQVKTELSDSWVNDIQVNNLGEKWFATNNGVSVLSADNSSWRYYFPYDNSIPDGLVGDIIEGPMLDSSVGEILFDEEKNLAIFLYSKGFSFLNYSGVTKDSDIDQFTTNPSPFLNDGSSIMQFVLSDLKTYDSAIIYNLRGKVVRGGTGSKRLDLFNGWNGRDNSGEIAASGIYQVLIYDSEDPVKNVTGKIAVVRK